MCLAPLYPYPQHLTTHLTWHPHHLLHPQIHPILLLHSAQQIHGYQFTRPPPQKWYRLYTCICPQYSCLSSSVPWSSTKQARVCAQTPSTVHFLRASTVTLPLFPSHAVRLSFLSLGVLQRIFLAFWPRLGRLFAFIVAFSRFLFRPCARSSLFSLWGQFQLFFGHLRSFSAVTLVFTFFRARFGLVYAWLLLVSSDWVLIWSIGLLVCSNWMIGVCAQSDPGSGATFVAFSRPSRAWYPW